MECGKGQPVKIITDNSVETIVVGNTEISHPCNHTVPQHRDFMNTIITGDKSWVYVYDPEIVIFLAMKKSHSNAACHQLTLLIGETKFMYANKGCLRQVRFIEIHQDFVKKILNSGTFRTGSYLSTDQWE